MTKVSQRLDVVDPSVTVGNADGTFDDVAKFQYVMTISVTHAPVVLTARCRADLAVPARRPARSCTGFPPQGMGNSVVVILSALSSLTKTMADPPDMFIVFPFMERVRAPWACRGARRSVSRRA